MTEMMLALKTQQLMEMYPTVLLNYETEEEMRIEGLSN